MGKSARARAQAVRSTPGSRTDQTMDKLADLRNTLVAEDQSRKPHTKGSSKSARKRAARKASLTFDQMSDLLYAPGATKPGSRPTLNAGSIQASPPKARHTRPKGIKLQPFTDHIPGSPGDWTRSGGAQHGPAAGPAVLKYHWSSPGVDRDSMAFERAKTVTRPYHEARQVKANSVAGALDFQTGASRHEDDAATGVFRDEVGRVIRDTSMPDCDIRQVRRTVQVKNERGMLVQHEVEYITRDSVLTPREHATRAMLPGVRTKAAMRAEEQQSRANEKADVRKIRAEAREEKQAERDRLKAERQARKADAPERTEAQRATLDARRDMRNLAYKILADRGIVKPTAKQVRAVVEFFEGNMQRAQYMKAV